MSRWMTQVFFDDNEAAQALWDELSLEDWELEEVHLTNDCEGQDLGVVSLYVYGDWSEMSDRLVQFVKDNPSAYITVDADDGNRFIGFYAPGDGTAFYLGLEAPAFDDDDERDEWIDGEPWNPEYNTEGRQQLL